MSDFEPFETALDIALSIVNEPSKAPPSIEVRFIEPYDAIADARYMIIVFRAFGFLVDKETNKTTMLPLNVTADTPEALELSLQMRAREVAHQHNLSVVYFTKRKGM